MRHAFSKEYDPRPGVQIATLAYEYPRGYQVPDHAHGSDQLIYAIRGVMQISAGQSMWLTPPQFAIWIPAHTVHSIRMLGSVSMRTLYIRRGVCRGLPPQSVVLHITPLLRELIVEAVRLKELRSRNRLHCSLRDLLIAHLEQASTIPASITMPTDPRARAVADLVLESLSERRSLAQMCATVGAGVRTIQRLFRRDVGSDFELWRRQARLMKALEQLVSGYSVKQTSFALGYRQPTAFVTMFRGIMGTTPKAWTRALQRHPS